MIRRFMFAALLMSLGLAKSPLTAQPEAVVTPAALGIPATLLAGGAEDCAGAALTIDGEILVDFTSATATLSDPALAPFFTFTREGENPAAWTASFDFGNRPVIIGGQARIATFAGPDRPAPALHIHSRCSIAISLGASVSIAANNAATGNLWITSFGSIRIAGTVANTITGTFGRAGDLVVASLGPLTVESTASIRLAGAQEGTGDLSLASFGPGADTTILGLVDAVHYANRAPTVRLASFGGNLTLDGTTFTGLERSGSSFLRRGTGVRLRGEGVPASTALRAQAAGNLTIRGPRPPRFADGEELSFPLDFERDGAAPLPVTVTLSQSGENTVRLALSTTTANAHFRGLFLNLPASLNPAELRIESTDLTQQIYLIRDGVDGISGAWMAPVGGWDLGLGIFDGTSAELRLMAPGLRPIDLLGTQRDGWAMAVAVELPASADSSESATKTDQLYRMLLPDPGFDLSRGQGALALTSKGIGGQISLRALGGTIELLDHAVDHRNPDNSASRVSIEAQGAVRFASAADQPAITIANPGGVTQVRSHGAGVAVAAGITLDATGGSHALASCAGLDIAGTVTPADSDPSDDTGPCALAPEVAITEPENDALVTSQPFEVRGTASPSRAQLTVNGALVEIGEDGSWQTQLSGEEGLFTIVAESSLDQASATDTRTVRIDTMPPLVTIQAPERLIRGGRHDIGVLAADPSPIQAITLQAGRQTYPVVHDRDRASFTLDIADDDPNPTMVLRAQASDRAGHVGLAELTLPIVDPADLPDIALTVNAPDTESAFREPGQTLRGSVVPAGAEVRVNGVPITVDPGGTFEHAVTLGDGVNTYLFRATHGGYRPATAKRDLYLDLEPPSIVILRPEDPHETNLPEIEVAGRVADRYADIASFTRVGEDVPLTDGTFRETVPLTPGTQSLTYRAVDTMGNSAEVTLHVTRQTEPPRITLSHPVTVLPGGSFALAATPEPSANITRFEVSLNGVPIHQAADGTPFLGEQRHDGTSDEILVQARAVDRFGNRAEQTGRVTVARAHRLHGTLLFDATSHPAANLPVRVTTPHETRDLTSDSDGRFEAYVNGMPVTVTVEVPEYLTMVRRIETDQPSTRLADFRLTSKAEANGSGDARAISGYATLDLIGFGGETRLSPFGTQALPALLPIGFSPAGGFNLEASSNGRLQCRLEQLPESSLGAALYALQRESHAWRVLARENLGTSSLDLALDDLGTGDYLFAVRDTWSPLPAPEPGALLERHAFPLVPPGTQATAGCDPERVDLLQEPATRVQARFATDGHIPSGALARLTSAEHHERFSETLNLPDAHFDLFCYSLGFGDQNQPSRLGGVLAVRAQAEVDLDLTRSGYLHFSAYPGVSDPASFLADRPLHDLGSVTLDFTAAVTQNLVVDSRAVPTDGLPLIGGAESLAGFELRVGGTLPNDPIVRLDRPSESRPLVLLRRETRTRWSFAALLRPDPDRPGQLTAHTDGSMAAGGTFAVVALNEPVTLISGRATLDGSGIEGVEIACDHHPWFALSDDDGAYRQVVFQRDPAGTIEAYHAARHLGGRLALSSTVGRTELTGRDLDLSAAGFRVVGTAPPPGETHVPRNHAIVIAFNRPVGRDSANIAANLRLATSDGRDVPVSTLVSPGRLEIEVAPQVNLQPGRGYRLTVEAGLLGLHGDTLAESHQVNFTTAFPEISVIDLSRFYLEHESDRTYLIGPAETYPAGTRLTATLALRQESFDFTLAGGPFRGEVRYEPGQVLLLEAVTPDGAIHRQTVTTLRVDGGWQLGSSPFTMRISDRLDLAIDAVDYPGTVIVSTQPTSAADLASDLVEVSALHGFADWAPLAGVDLNWQGQGDRPPPLKGRILIDPGDTDDLADLILTAVFPPVAAPADPTRPEVLSPIPTAAIQATVRRIDGRWDGFEPEASGRLSLAFDLGQSPVPGLPPTNPGKAKRAQGFNLARMTTMVKSGANPYTYQFQQVDVASVPHADIERRSFEPHAWHDRVPGMVPVVGAPIYRASLPAEGIPEYHFMGVTGDNGRAIAHYNGITQSFFAVDPATGQLVGTDIVTDATHHDRTGRADRRRVLSQGLLDPAAYLAEQAGDDPQPPRLQLDWQVFDTREGQPVYNAGQTERLRGNVLLAADGRFIRLTVNSDQPVTAARLDVSGLGSPPPRPANQPNRVVFDVGGGAVSNQGLIHLELVVENEAGLSATVQRDILIRETGQTVRPLDGVAPRVVAHVPDKNARDIPVDTRFYIGFSEPVTGISESRVTLTGNRDIPLRFIDHNGDEIQPDSIVDRMYLETKVPMSLGAQHTLTITGLRDTNPDDPPFQPFTLTFTTAELRDSEAIQPDLHTPHWVVGNGAVTTLRNLVLYIHQARDNDTNPVLDLYDARAAGRPMALKSRHPLIMDAEAPDSQTWNYRICLFTPEELEIGDGLEGGGPLDFARLEDRTRLPLDDLPSGSVLAVAVLNQHRAHYDNRPFLFLFRYGAGGFDFIKKHPLDTHPGVPFALDKTGPYLFVGFLAALGQNGGTTAFDMRVLLDPSRRPESESDRPRAAELRQEGVASMYRSPGSVTGLVAFNRTEGGAQVPTFLAAGAQFPAIYHFDPGMPASVHASPDLDQVVYDTRLLHTTNYPNLGDRGKPFGTDAGVAEDLSFVDPADRRRKTRDIAVFSYSRIQEGGSAGTLQVYVLPSGGPSQEPLAPVFELGFEPGIGAMAVDAETGLVAVADAVGRYSILDLRALLESGDASSNLGFAHAAFLFPPRAGQFWSMTFHDGNLLALDHQGLRRINVVPRPYRTVGWEILDLKRWTRSRESTVSFDTVDFNPYIVFHATDDVFRAEDAMAFHMEVGSFAVQMLSRGKVTLTFERDGTTALPELSQTTQRDAAHLLTFNTRSLVDHYRDGAADDLRSSGVHAWQVRYRIEDELGQLVEHNAFPFLVAYHPPATDYLDGMRHIQGLDALARMPDLLAVDHRDSSLDARLDISPRRVYNHHFAYEPQRFGVGMADGQLLYMAMPVWWALSGERALPEGFHTGERAVQRVVFQQPGAFRLSAEPDREGRVLDVRDDLLTQIHRDENGWVLDHRQSMIYRLSARATTLPTYPALFAHWNRHLEGRDDVADQLRYPVFRFRTGIDGPDNLLHPVPLAEQVMPPWGNRMTFVSGGGPSDAPNQITEEVADAGGRRHLTTTFAGTEVGSLVDSLTTAHGLQLDYDHDDEGYLTTLTTNSNGLSRRQMRYTWEAIGPPLGSFQLKRLTAMTAVGGDSGDVRHAFSYEGSGTVVSGLIGPFGSQPLTVRETNGLPSSVTLAGVGGAPDAVVTFSLQEGMLLSSGYRRGSTPFSLAWMKRDGDGRFTWRLSADSYLGQQFGYDNLGRMTRHTQLEGSENWAFDHAAPFLESPSSYTDPLRITFALGVNAQQRGIQVGERGITTFLSPSGAPIRQRNLLGHQRNVEGSRFYAPHGTDVESHAGRVTTVRVPGRSVAAETVAYNRFGEPEVVTSMGIERVLQYDDVGRLATVTDINDEQIVYDYSYENGLLRTVATHVPSGLVETTDRDLLGRLVHVFVDHDQGRDAVRYRYDQLSRLEMIEDLVNEGRDTTFVYYGNTDLPTQVIQPGVVVDFPYDDTRWQPRVDGATLTIDGLSESIPFGTDIFGRVTRTRLDDVGEVAISYDAFGVAKTIAETGEGGERIALDYGAGQVHVDNGFADLEGSMTWRDPAGLTRDMVLEGSSLDSGRIQLGHRTVIRDMLGVSPHGHHIATTATNPETLVPRGAAINARGGFAGAGFGHLAITAPTANTYGQPTTIAGSVQGSLDYDAYGRVTKVDTVHGHQATLGYDELGRLGDGRDVRGKIVAFDYADATPDLVQVTKTDDAADAVTVHHTPDRNASDDTTWLDQTTSVRTETPGEVYTIRRDDKTATIRFDLDTGQLLEIVDFEQQATTFSWQDYGRGVIQTHPDQRTETYRFDGLGNLKSWEHSYGDRFEATRDSDNRLQRIQTREYAYDFAWTGTILTGITGGREDLRLRDHNLLGLPERIEVGDVATYDIDYHRGGRVRCIITRPKGGLPTERRYNSFGDLTFLRRHHQFVSYSYNQWGYPVSMTLGTGETYELHQDKQRMNLPGVVLHNDEAGQVVRVEQAGMQDKLLTHDGNGQVTNITIGGETQQTFHREAGQVREITTHAADFQAEHYRIDWTDGKPRQILKDQLVMERFQYFEAQESRANPAQTGQLKSHQDPNGIWTDFRYDAQGHLRQLSIREGPTIDYRYDAAGNVTSVQAMGMGTRFDNYENGIPAGMTWGNGTRFRVDQTEGRLTGIEEEGGELGIRLNWDNLDTSGPICTDPEGTAYHGPTIRGLERLGPGFVERMSPRYDAHGKLTGTGIERDFGGTTQTFDEDYGEVVHDIMSQLVRTAGPQKAPLVNAANTRDGAADDRRILEQGAHRFHYDAAVGNLTGLDYGEGNRHQLLYDGFRRLREIRSADGGIQTFAYDLRHRRVSATSQATDGRLVYVYQGSRVVAVGIQREGEVVQWTHVIGHGPLGPTFLKDLTGSGYDAYILTDHLGTPFAWQNAATGEVRYTPYSPWGELLATAPGRAPPYAGGQSLPSEGLALAGDALFPTPPLGLGGHPYDHDTGLVYMHHRFYHPRLGHFLNPDYREPDIYDISTINEPYAYAGANPFLFWDPDGLAHRTSYRDADDNVYWQEYSEDQRKLIEMGGDFEVSINGELYLVEGSSIPIMDPIKRVQWVNSGGPIRWLTGRTDLKRFDHAAFTRRAAAITASTSTAAVGGRVISGAGRASLAAGRNTWWFLRNPVVGSKWIYYSLSNILLTPQGALIGEEALRGTFEAVTGVETGLSVNDLIPAYGKRKVAKEALDTMDELLAPFRSKADEIIESARINWSALDGWEMTVSPSGNTVISTTMLNKILFGERVLPGNTLRGGHSSLINEMNPDYAVEVLSTNPNGTRVVKFITQYSDGNLSKIKKSTLFPNSWSDSDIIQAILEVGDSPAIFSQINNQATMHRLIVKGIEVEVFKIGPRVISAYPTGN
ncbi:Ig-like domain-containing protein [Sulfidibacter corallicola]|uniref:Ig-like domain-containing protein n=1 Tax=Sulfidibacter corallicola TaxID=2818388 RepID=A0A8A4TIP0_SULCO|nr:Ig-like domain-containing protein [Sulfidibacter corallicola]QTD49473.1 Ig-like domain-containing protein [Sulfidibacter corallicola]